MLLLDPLGYECHVDLSESKWVGGPMDVLDVYYGVYVIFKKLFGEEKFKVLKN